MALASSFAVNQKVVLEILDGSDRGRFPTRVEEVRSDGLVIAAPLIGRQPLQLAPGTPVRLQSEDTGSGVIAIETKVWESRPVTPDRRLPVIILEQGGRLQQMQRRADVRIDVAIPLRFGILTIPEEGEAGETTMWPTLEATTADISAGGSQIITEVRLVPGTQLDVHLRLPDSGDTLQLVGEVMRLLRSEERGSRTLHYLAVRWIGAESKDRDAIVAFIFREQLRLRRRGML